MTHAALKDLLKVWDARAVCPPEASSESEMRRFTDEEGFVRSAAISRCARELRAALSAVDGEAVPYAFIQTCSFPGVEHLKARGKPAVFTCQTIKDDLFTIPIYTAPPPQQAASDEDAAEKYRVAWQAGRDAQKAEQAATQPQQAGGDRPFCWMRFRNGQPDWAEDCLSLEDVLEDYDPGDGYSMQPLYLRATPPQPEAGGGEALDAARYRRLRDCFHTHGSEFMTGPNDDAPKFYPRLWFGEEKMIAHGWERYVSPIAVNPHEADKLRRGADAAPFVDAWVDAALSTTPASGGEHEKES